MNKNNKGFTLVELLATLTILSIIMLIAVPSVINIIDREKNTTYINDAKRFIALAKYKYRIDNKDTDITYTLSVLNTDELKESPNGTYSADKSNVTIKVSGTTTTYTVRLCDTTECVCDKTEADLQNYTPATAGDIIKAIAVCS